MSIANDLERLMLELINEERTSRGLDALALELNLNASSEVHSDWMLDEDIFSHTGDGGSSAGDRMRDSGFDFDGSWSWGENIAWQSVRGAEGFEDDVANLHDALMNSPGHRANILNANFDYIGIGVEIGNMNGWDAVMITQNFASTGGTIELDLGDVPVAPNMAPGVTLPYVLLDPTQTLNIGSLANYSDADGDTAIQFQIRGSLTDVDLRLDGNSFTPGAGAVFAAQLLNTLTARAQSNSAEAELEIRAYDGEDWGAWDQFEMRVPPEAAQFETIEYGFYNFVAGPVSGPARQPDIDVNTTDVAYFIDETEIFTGADHFEIT